jgi:hypothetical protein
VTGVSCIYGGYHAVSQNTFYLNSSSDITIAAVNSIIQGNGCYSTAASSSVTEVSPGNYNYIANNGVKNTVTTSGASTIATGNVSTSGPGVPGQSLPTWSPVLQIAGSPATGHGYSVTTAGAYQLIGNTVVAQFEVIITTKGLITGAVTVAGLPFPANSGSFAGGGGQGTPNYSGFSGLSGAPLLDVPAGSSSISLNQGNATSVSAVTDLNLTGSTTFYGTVTYFI